jgi:hypothetical protein
MLRRPERLNQIIFSTTAAAASAAAAAFFDCVVSHLQIKAFEVQRNCRRWFM